jgi:hypothetical protein
MAHLIMAGLWLILGGVLIAWQMQHPGAKALTILGTGISFGWLALVLALYDLVRWWNRRTFLYTRESLAKTQSMPHRHEESEPSSAPEILNPEFNFTDEPPSSGR